jgi:hypothetical protein
VDRVGIYGRGEASPKVKSKSPHNKGAASTNLRAKKATKATTVPNGLSVSAQSAKRRGPRTMRYAVDPRVDAYLDSLPDWQQAVCRRVRELVHAVDREVVETIKRTRLPYFVLQGNICALLGAKDHVNVFLYDGGIVPDPEGIITGGHDNKTARTVAIRKGDAINARALTAIIQRIIANNRAGGWRKLKRSRKHPHARE